MGENQKCKKTRTTIYKILERAKMYPHQIDLDVNRGFTVYMDKWMDECLNGIYACMCIMYVYIVCMYAMTVYSIHVRNASTFAVHVCIS